MTSAAVDLEIGSRASSRSGSSPSASCTSMTARPYFLQALQDRSTEVATLNALLTVLLAGGLVAAVVAVAFGTVYARRALVPIRDSLDRAADGPPAPARVRRGREPRAANPARPSSAPRWSTCRATATGRSASRPEALDDIDAEVSHLALLVDDLLLLARSDSGAVPLERVLLDLGDVASDAASSMARTAEERGVRVAVDPEPAILAGDPVRLRQLVTILVDNAIRHSPRGGEVTVRVRADGSTASLDVADQGPGLRPDDMAHVFDRFYRAPGAPSGGTGLGLAIARWIVERHGGRIGVRNGEAGGAVFRAELPQGGGGPGPGRPEGSPGGPSAG